MGCRGLCQACAAGTLVPPLALLPLLYPHIFIPSGHGSWVQPAAGYWVGQSLSGLLFAQSRAQEAPSAGVKFTGSDSQGSHPGQLLGQVLGRSSVTRTGPEQPAESSGHTQAAVCPKSHDHWGGDLSCLPSPRVHGPGSPGAQVPVPTVGGVSLPLLPAPGNTASGDFPSPRLVFAQSRVTNK